MEGYLKLSTAVNITVLMIDSTDHITGKTGLSAGLTIYASKAAGTPAAITPTVTELDATNVKGLYKLAFTTSHVDTLGELQIHVTGTGADPTDIKWQVVTDLPGIAQTGDNFARLGAPAGASVSADIAAAKVDTAAIKVKTDFLPSATAGAAGGVFIAGSNAATSITTALTANVIGNVTGNLSGFVGSVTGLTASDVGAIKTQTDKLTFTVANHLDVNVLKWIGGTIPAVNVTGVPLVDLKYTLGTISPAAAGSVRADAVTGAVGSVTGNLGGNVIGNLNGSVMTDVVGNVNGAVTSVTGAVGSVTGNVGGNVNGSVLGDLAGNVNGVVFACGSVTGNVGGNVVGNVNGSVGWVDVGGITAASFAAGAINAAAIATDAIDADALKADAVTEIQAGLSTLNAAGVRTAVGLASANLDTQLAALPTASGNADAVWDEPLAGHAGAGSAGLALANATAPSAATVADAVWDELLSGHAVSGSAGAALSAAGSAGDPWLTALPGAYGAGTAGKIVGDNLDAAISSRTKPADTQAAVTLVATTTNLTNAATNGDLTATMKTSVTTAATAATPIAASVTGAVGSVAGNVGGNVTGSVGSVVGAVGSVTGGVTVTTNSDKTGYALTSGERTALAGVVWATVMEGSRTAIQYMRGFGAALLGKASGMATTTATFRDVDDSKDRIVATVDADGNRPAITLDLT